ncbi:PaaI family thioesterase [Lachnospiraceae bacterium ZAX-1]
MDFQELMRARNAYPGFAKELGIHSVSMEAGYAKMEMATTEFHRNPIGTVHGGAIFSLADTVGGLAALSRGRYVTTVSGNINYLHAAGKATMLIGEAREVKAGKSLGIYDVTITDENGKLISTATMTYYYLGKVGEPATYGYKP